MDLIKKYIKDNNLHTDSEHFTRKDEDKWRRYHLMKYLRRNYSLAKTGDFFGLNHATVINGIKAYEILKDYEDFKYLTSEVRFLFPLDDSGKMVCRSEFEVISLVTLEAQAQKVLNSATF